MGQNEALWCGATGILKVPITGCTYKGRQQAGSSGVQLKLSVSGQVSGIF